MRWDLLSVARADWTWFGLAVLLAVGLGIALMVGASFAYGQSAAPEEAAPAILPCDLTPYRMFMFGLAAAIPAVVIYNWFPRAIANYRALCGDASVEILTLVSRDLSQRPSDQTILFEQPQSSAAKPAAEEAMNIRLDHGEDSLLAGRKAEWPR
jgi:hypothetical protein